MQTAYESAFAGVGDPVVADYLRGRLVKRVPVASPAAGAEWSAQVPSGAVWIVDSITALLTTSAVVANRSPDLQVTDNDGALLSAVPPPASIAASLAARYYWLRTIAAAWAAGANKQPTPLPTTILPAGAIIKSSTLNLDVGDAWTAIVLYVIELTEHSILAQADWIEERAR